MPTEPVYLGIEGGGTRTIAIAGDKRLNVIARAQAGPGNVRLLSGPALQARFRELAGQVPSPASIAIGLAGVRDSQDQAKVEAAAANVWPGVPVMVTNDLEIALAAAELPGNTAAVLILSGTGSCCYGRAPEGRVSKVGGWGHLLGDLSSAYDIANRAVRQAVYDYDRFGRWGALGAELLRSLVLNAPEDLIGWMQEADKRAVAHLAPTVFATYRRDRVATEVIDQAAAQLAHDSLLCAGRLKLAPVHYVFAGSVLKNQESFRRRIAGIIRKEQPNASFRALRKDGAWGAVKLASMAGHEVPAAPDRNVNAPIYVPSFDASGSPTEARNPRSGKLDKLSIARGVELMLDEEEELVPALREQQRQIGRAVRLASDALRRGGRIIYVGAGTSGRLGVLDASECPPTFRVAPEMVQGIMAGGQRALWQAVEGAEDDAGAGVAAINGRSVTQKDLVIGIAASGRTPFVWGALAEARMRQAKTVLICFNPNLRIERAHRPDLIIAPDVGPEVLTGSTRLKAGTATKLILNMITTLSMVQMGKVVSNLMIDLNPSNVKLRDRAVRILCELTGASSNEAGLALAESGWVVKEAWLKLRGRQKNVRARRT